MSFAPVSSLGAFLKARLAVNGIQCAARSFGTLTPGAAGFLSSIGTSLQFERKEWLIRKLSASRCNGNVNRPRYLPLGQADFARVLTESHRALSQVAGGDPEHLALGLRAVEPEQRQLRKRHLQKVTAAPDLAEQAALRRQMCGRLVQDAPDDREAIGAAVEGKFRLGAAFRRQRRHA